MPPILVVNYDYDSIFIYVFDFFSEPAVTLGGASFNVIRLLPDGCCHSLLKYLHVENGKYSKI